LREAITKQDSVDLGETHRGLEKVFQVSTCLNFALTLDEIATFFLPRATRSGEELRSLIVEGHFAKSIPIIYAAPVALKEVRKPWGLFTAIALPALFSLGIFAALGWRMRSRILGSSGVSRGSQD
jgi:hypothetical protein